MLRFNMVKPFILEFVTMIFVIGTVIIIFAVENFVTIKLSFLTVAALVILTIYLSIWVSRVSNWGIKAILDLLFQKTENCICKFNEILPYTAGAFSEKKGRGGKSVTSIYYLIEMNGVNDHYRFISPNYIDLKKGRTYKIVYSKFSQILIKYEEIVEI